MAIDWVVGLSIFLLMVVFVFSYVQFYYIGQDRSKPVTAFDIMNDIIDNTSHEIYKIPVKTSNPGIYPYELNYNLTADNQSITLGFPTDFSGKIIWVGNSSWFNIYYTKNTSLTRNWTTNLNKNGMNFSNPSINFTVSEGDITKFNTSFLTLNDFNTGLSGCSAEKKHVYGEISCPDKVWRFYSNTTIFRGFKNFEIKNISMDYFETNETSGDINYTDSSLLYSGYTDFIFFNTSSNGLGLYGPVYSEIYNNGSVQVEGEVVIYPFQSDKPREYTNLSVKAGYSTVQEMLFYPYVLSLNSTDYSTLKNKFGSDFNFKIKNIIEIGKDIPKDRNVVANQRDIYLLKNGKVEKVKLLVAIW